MSEQRAIQIQAILGGAMEVWMKYGLVKLYLLNALAFLGIL